MLTKQARKIQPVVPAQVVASLQKWIDKLITELGPAQYQYEMARKYWDPETTFEQWKNLTGLEAYVTEDQAIYVELDSEGDWLKEVFQKLIAKFATNRGYYVSNQKCDYHRCKVMLEPYYGKRIRVPQLIYHAFPTFLVSVIRRRGIVPKAGHRREAYPPRIYFALNEQDANEIMSALMMSEVSPEDYYSGHAGQAYSIAVIDTSKLYRGTKFYKDPSFPKGAWTYSSIPPGAITEIKGEEEEREYAASNKFALLAEEFEDGEESKLDPLENEVINLVEKLKKKKNDPKVLDVISTIMEMHVTHQNVLKVIEQFQDGVKERPGLPPTQLKAIRNILKAVL